MGIILNGLAPTILSNVLLMRQIWAVDPIGTREPVKNAVLTSHNQ